MPATRRSKSRRTATPGPPPRADKVSNLVYSRLRDLIVGGRLAPGAPLIETELSERLGASRTPVRAALQRLQQEGFVAATRTGRMQRAVVAPLTVDDMRELFLMVGALEASAARSTAEMDAPRRDAIVRDLTTLHDRMRQSASARPPDLAQAHDLHVRCHRVITSGAGPRLRAELDVLQPQAERYERVYTSAILLAFDESLAEHERILGALGDGDGDAVEAAVAESWRSAARRYHDVVTIFGERGNW